jgi:TonB family protein
MLNTLIESRAHSQRNASGTAAAIFAHALLIGGALYATASATIAPDETPVQVALHYIQSRPAPAPIVRQPAKQVAVAPQKQVAPIPTAPVEIAPSLPPIDAPLAGPATPPASDFPVSTGNAGETAGTAATGEPPVYDAAEVESQVAVKSGFRPEYPAALRASGTEGRVVVQFIVTADGKTDPSSIRILSSTNELFAESVRHALLKSRFRAAKIGSRAVPQLVQQLFVFKLDR